MATGSRASPGPPAANPGGNCGRWSATPRGSGSPSRWRGTGSTAFGRSFTAFQELITGLATGAQGTPPASVTLPGGDVHHSYLTEVGLPAGVTSPTVIRQLVCSPIHNLLPDNFRQLQRIITSRAGAVIGGTLARLARVPAPQIGWRLSKGPWFSNMLAALDFDGRHARVRFDRSGTDPTRSPHLIPVDQTDLS